MRALLLLLPTTACLPELEPVDDQAGPVSCDKDLPETGDQLVQLGALQVPYTFCGEMDTTGNDGNRYTGDVDRTVFSLRQVGRYQFRLRWDQFEGDYDLYLFEVEGEDTFTEVAKSSTAGYPEALEETLAADQSYAIVVAGWSGPAGGWSVEIDKP